MNLDQLDVAIRLCAISVTLILAWLLFRQRRQIGHSAYVFPLLALCLSGFLAGNTPVTALRPTGVIAECVHLCSGLTVVFLWWFCLSCFDRSFKIGGWVLLIGIAWTVIACTDRGVFGPALASKGLSYVLIAMGYGIVAHIFWRLLSDYQGDLIQKRHDARLIVAVLLGGQLLIDLTADLIFGLSWRPEAFAMVQNLAILGFGLWFAAHTLEARGSALTFKRERAPDRPTPARRQVDVLTARLDHLMQDKRIFLDPQLSFDTFVTQMQAPEKTVRALVSQELGFDHFRQFLNHYRIDEARRLLKDPARSEDKLITIAFDSGFASLATFNRVFRELEGCAPSRFRSAPRNKNAQPSGFEKRSATF